LILAIFSVFSPVYADIAPPTTSPSQLAHLYYHCGSRETTAWLIGAEFLWRMIKKTDRDKPEPSRSNVYRIMFLTMILSFLIGVLFWKVFGWV
jgi:hypothetical protein